MAAFNNKKFSLEIETITGLIQIPASITEFEEISSTLYSEVDRYKDTMKLI